MTLFFGYNAKEAGSESAMTDSTTNGSWAGEIEANGYEQERISYEVNHNTTRLEN